jgi:zinc/manganese transport system ATP-binding protein
MAESPRSGDAAPPPDRTPAPGGTPPADDRTAPAVELVDAAIRLGGRTIWSHVNLEVDPGHFVAVLGPNGVGKSTLIKAILGILPLSEGRMTVLGREAGDAGRDIGYLPQRRNFDANLRVRGIDVVRLGSDGDRWGLPLPGASSWTARGRQQRQRVDEVIELVGATSYARRPIGQVSGGEQQRLLIAQALVRRPRMLLLDEPLDSLDLPNQAAVAGLIRRIASAEEVAVLLVAHDVNPLAAYLDRVVYLAGGQALCGEVDEVINAETLSALYGTRIEVLRSSDGRLVVVGQPEAPHHHGHRHG